MRIPNLYKYFVSNYADVCMLDNYRFGQYLFPLIVLLENQGTTPPKDLVLLFTISIFVYSWIPVNILGWFRRHNKVWSHTVHTRAVGLDDVKLTRIRHKE